MIHQVKGDLLLTGAPAIAHGVAPSDHFNQGLAKSLRERYPALYVDFRHYCNQHHPREGGLWAWAGVGEQGAAGHIIVNLFTQAAAAGHSGAGHPGKASHESVNHALRELAKYLVKEKIPAIALPCLATGVGGLKWDEVLPLIEHHLAALETEVYVYVEYHAGVKAAE